MSTTNEDFWTDFSRFAFAVLLTAVLVALSGLVTAPTASAQALHVPQTRAAAIDIAGSQLVEAHDPVLPGQSRPRAPSPATTAVGTCVAPEGGAAPAGGNPTANPLGGEYNCVACAIAGDARLGGSAASALDVGPQFQSAIESNLGGSFVPVSGESEITAILEEEGLGARGIVWGSRGTGAIGHVFNAVNQGGVIRYIDFQSGGAASFEGFKSFDFLLTHGGS